MTATARKRKPPAPEKVARKAWDAFIVKAGDDPLVTLTEVAALLGIRKPNVYKLKEQGRLPEAVVEAANGPLWLRAEVEVLAREVQADRARRAAPAS